MEAWRYNPSNFNLSIKRSRVDSVTLRLLYWRGKNLSNILWVGICVGLGAGVVVLQYNLLLQARTKPRLHRHPARSLVTIRTELSRLAQRNTLLLENYTGVWGSRCDDYGDNGLVMIKTWGRRYFRNTVPHLENDTMSHPRTEPWDLRLWFCEFWQNGFWYTKTEV